MRPADIWRVLVQLQDSHGFLKNQQPARPPFQDVLDVRLAYVEVGRPKEAPLRARIGRQEIAFGEERLMGKAE